MSILVFDGVYSDKVLAGFGNGVDDIPNTHVADPTDIDELRLYFLYPDWPSGRWMGMQRPRSNGRRPTRIKNETTVTSMFEDGSEYEEKTPSPVLQNGKVVGVTRYPMRRVTEKPARPGHTRRVAKFNDAFDAWCEAYNCNTADVDREFEEAFTL